MCTNSIRRAGLTVGIEEIHTVTKREPTSITTTTIEKEAQVGYEDFCDYLRDKLDIKNSARWTGLWESYLTNDQVPKTFHGVTLNVYSQAAQL